MEAYGSHHEGGLDLPVGSEDGSTLFERHRCSNKSRSWICRTVDHPKISAVRTRTLSRHHGRTCTSVWPHRTSGEGVGIRCSRLSTVELVSVPRIPKKLTRLTSAVWGGGAAGMLGSMCSGSSDQTMKGSGMETKQKRRDGNNSQQEREGDQRPLIYHHREHHSLVPKCQRTIITEPPTPACAI